MIDEQNYVDPKVMRLAYNQLPQERIKSNRWAQLRWRVRKLKWSVEESWRNTRNKFRKLPEEMCCWNMNVCYDIECKDCGSRDWACAYCGHASPCTECNPTQTSL